MFRKIHVNENNPITDDKFFLYLNNSLFIIILSFLEAGIQRKFRLLYSFFLLETTGFPKENNRKKQLYKTFSFIIDMKKNWFAFSMKDFVLEKFLFQILYGFKKNKNKRIFGKNRNIFFYKKPI
mmetsp:Transcript_61274/g.126577  ORF Transcript_61274/g.126577 Transcript_61274/m.126577 type:complete len:124 (-) Transcript_61274:1563-1934(-)